MNQALVRREIVAFRILGLALSSIFAHPTFADDAICRPVFEAETRLLKTPNHQFVSLSSPATDGTAMKSETIYIGNARFMKIEGQWSRSPVTADDIQRQREQYAKNGKISQCRQLPDESAESVKASVYVVHSSTERGVSDEKVWISKTDGLPLRSVTDMVAVGGSGKTHIELRVVYTDVSIPAVAK